MASLNSCIISMCISFVVFLAASTFLTFGATRGESESRVLRMFLAEFVPIGSVLVAAERESGDRFSFRSTLNCSPWRAVGEGDSETSLRSAAEFSHLPASDEPLVGDGVFVDGAPLSRICFAAMLYRYGRGDALPPSCFACASALLSRIPTGDVACASALLSRMPTGDVAMGDETRKDLASRLATGCTVSFRRVCGVMARSPRLSSSRSLIDLRIGV